MNKLEEYLEAKKDGFKETAKKAAITGLVAATILTGAAGLTSCDKDSVEAETKPCVTDVVKPAIGEVVSSIESNIKEIKDNFELDRFNVVNNGGKCRFVLQDIDEATIDDEDELGMKFLVAYSVSEDFFNKVYNKVQGNENENLSIIEMNGIIGVFFKKEAIKDERYADILAEIQSIVESNEPSYYEDYEAPIMGD